MQRLLVLGTGAMASLFGARLARSGHASVTLAGSWEAALSTIGRQGITVHDAGHAWTVAVDAVSRTAPLEDFDNVIVLTKSFQTAELASVAGAAVRPGGLILTLQNGLGNREALERGAHGAHVAVGVTTIGATLVAPGCVRAFPGRIVLGVTDANRQPLQALERLIAQAGIDVATTEAIDEQVWLKLAVNCAINPLTAILGVPNGALVQRPEWLDTMTGAAREVAHVASARGLELRPDEAAEMAARVSRATADNRSSMLQDLTRGSQTEVDAMNGAVCREALRHGVATPINQHLYETIKSEERRRAATDRRASP